MQTVLGLKNLLLIQSSQDDLKVEQVEINDKPEMFVQVIGYVCLVHWEVNEVNRGEPNAIED